MQNTIYSFKNMINTTLRRKADKLFWIFENKFFQNTGNYPRNTNLVLEFSDFIAHASQDDLEKYVSFSSSAEYKKFKTMINQGIDLWLGDIDLNILSNMD